MFEKGPVKITAKQKPPKQKTFPPKKSWNLKKRPGGRKRSDLHFSLIP